MRSGLDCRHNRQRSVPVARLAGLSRSRLAPAPSSSARTDTPFRFPSASWPGGGCNSLAIGAGSARSSLPSSIGRALPRSRRTSSRSASPFSPALQAVSARTRTLSGTCTSSSSRRPGRRGTLRTRRGRRGPWTLVFLRASSCGTAPSAAGQNNTFSSSSSPPI
jgi:hypothetical protein